MLLHLEALKYDPKGRLRRRNSLQFQRHDCLRCLLISLEDIQVGKQTTWSLILMIGAHKISYLGDGIYSCKADDGIFRRAHTHSVVAERRKFAKEELTLML